MKSSLAVKNICLIACLSSSASVSASDQWPMYQANPSHTGYIPVNINTSDISLRWKKQLGSLVLNPVTAANGYIFVSQLGYFNKQRLYVLLKNGTINWAKSFPDVYSVNPPSYADGKVYIQTGNNSPGTFLHAYNIHNGYLVFESPHGAQWERYLSPTIYKETVYINGGSYGGMYSFDGKSGSQKWFYDGLPQVDGWTPAVDDKWAYSYIGALYVVDRLTGQAGYKISSSGDNPVVPMLGGANDVFVIDGGVMTKFNTDTRKIAWQKIYNFTDDYTGRPALANGIVYAGTTLGKLAAIDQVTGNKLWAWKNPSGKPLQSNIIVTNSHVFVGTEDETYCVDLKTHQNVWSYPAGGDLTLAESALYIANGSGLLTAFKLGLGDLFAPSSVSFPKPVPVNTTRLTAIMIKNVGDKPVTISNIISRSSSFKVDTIPTSFVITPNQSKPIDISFTPTVAAILETDLVIRSDDQNEPRLLVHLKGKGI